MSYGIRIRHNKARYGLFPVPLPHKPFPSDVKRPVCGACQRATGREIRHACKTVHLVLDDEGCAIVAREIWDDFRKCVNHAGFLPANLVLEPPGQVVTPPTQKIKLDGVQFGLVQSEKRKQHSTGSGRMTRTDDEAPDILSIDDYLDKSERLGIPADRALNRLLAAAVRDMTNGGMDG